MRTCPALLALALAATTVHADPAPVADTGHYARVTTDPGKTQRRVALYTALGGCALMLSSGLLSAHERSVYDARVAAGDVQGANDAWATAHYTGTALFAGGVIALGTAMVLHLTAPEKHTVITPVASPGGVGMAVAGHF